MWSNFGDQIERPSEVIISGGTEEWVVARGWVAAWLVNYSSGSSSALTHLLGSFTNPILFLSLKKNWTKIRCSPRNIVFHLFPLGLHALLSQAGFLGTSAGRQEKANLGCWQIISGCVLYCFLLEPNRGTSSSHHATLKYGDPGIIITPFFSWKPEYSLRPDAQPWPETCWIAAQTCWMRCSWQDPQVIHRHSKD